LENAPKNIPITKRINGITRQNTALFVSSKSMRPLYSMPIIYIKILSKFNTISKIYGLHLFQLGINAKSNPQKGHFFGFIHLAYFSAAFRLNANASASRSII
jgi:hypothetical protein